MDLDSDTPKDKLFDPLSEEAHEDKQTTEENLDAATSTATAETEKVPAAA